MAIKTRLCSYESEVIGCLSALTVFAPMRRLEFRTSDVIFFEMLPAFVIVRLNDMPTMSDSIGEFGFRLDLKVILESCLLVTCGLVVVKLLLGAFDLLAFGSKADRTSTIEPTHLVYSRSHGLPMSIGTLTSHEAMSFAWDSGLFVPTTHKAERLRRLVNRIARRPRMGSNRSNRKVVAGFARVESANNAADNEVSSAEDASHATILVAKPIAHPATSSNNESPGHGSIYQVELRSREV